MSRRTWIRRQWSPRGNILEVGPYRPYRPGVIDKTERDWVIVPYLVFEVLTRGRVQVTRCRNTYWSLRADRACTWLCNRLIGAGNKPWLRVTL